MNGDFLHAINGNWDSLIVAIREDRRIAKRIDASGMTVLHWVCLHQDTPTDIVVKVIFANPYAVHTRNEAGHLPIDLAIEAECGERILEVLRAAAHGNRGPEDEESSELYRHDYMGKSEGEEPATEISDYHLPYNDHTILHDNDIRDGSDYQPHQNHTYYQEGDDAVDEDELEYQQQHRQYQPQPFHQPPRWKHKPDRRLSDQNSSFFNPPRANYEHTRMYGGYVSDLQERDDSNMLSRSDPHVKSLLTEQRLRERENDLISIATAEDSLPLGMFDPSKGPLKMAMMSSFPEEVKPNHGNVNVVSKSLSVGPRSKAAFPPRWKQLRMCHVCACGFTLVKRRHHCRNCGQSVCSQHSTNRVSLPKFALSEPQRVCDQCFLSGHHIMVPAQRGTPSIVSSYKSLPAPLQQEDL